MNVIVILTRFCFRNRKYIDNKLVVIELIKFKNK